MPRSLRFLKLAAVNSGLLLVGLLAVELIFGTWIGDPLAQINIRRGTETPFSAAGLYPGGTEVVYRRDEWGFRGPGVDPATIDILTIGGSTTNQLYLPEGQTWQAVMEAAFAEEGRRITVANAGVDGQSTVGHIVNFDLWFPHVPGLQPKMILAYVGVNDAMVTGNGWMDSYSWNDKLGFSSFYKWFRHHSALFRLGRTIEGMLGARSAKLTHRRVDFDNAEWTDTPNFPDNESARPGHDTEAYAKRLAVLAEKIRSLGAEPVFVTQIRGDVRWIDGKLMGLAAEKGAMNGLDHYRLLSAFNAVTMNVCRLVGAICLDLAGEVEFGPGDFYDYVHNTPQGAEKIGRWLHAQLKDQL